MGIKRSVWGQIGVGFNGCCWGCKDLVLNYIRGSKRFWRVCYVFSSQGRIQDFGNGGRNC